MRQIACLAPAVFAAGGRVGRNGGTAAGGLEKHMALAMIIAAIWLASFAITELLFAFFDLWKQRQLAQRATGELLAAKRS